MSHKKMPPHADILVIEMNNDENKIMGIGQIKNQTASEVYRTPSVRIVSKPEDNNINNNNKATTPPSYGGGTPPQFRKIFSDRNYNRYIYIGNEYYVRIKER